MKYYIIVGEASGDLHASHLMKEIKKQDTNANFRFFGGDMMTAVGGTCVKHYKDLAYMGFIPVLLHLRSIFRNMKLCKQDIIKFSPDCVILVDYPGFNLNIAEFLKKHTSIPIYYYISPKIWAWKEYRIKNIKRDIDKLFSILPFEVHFFEQKHGYPIHYVGNPTAQEVREFQAEYTETFQDFTKKNNLSEDKKILAVLCGSRKQEIRDNLPKMLKAAKSCITDDFQIVIAGAPGIDNEYYNKYISEASVNIVYGQTYPLLHYAHTALVTSGTATLETALFRVPQLVCYETGLHFIIKILRKLLLKVPFISLVNLIANKEVVPELVADRFTVDNICKHLKPLVEDAPERSQQMEGYNEIMQLLGTKNAPEEAIKIITNLLKKHTES